MIENLAEMIKTGSETMIQPPIKEEVPVETASPVPVETPVEAPEPVAEERPERSVDIITLPEWLDLYAATTDVKAVKIAIKGVNTENILIVSYPTGAVLEDGSDEKDVELFKRATKIPSLNLEAVEVNIYNNSYRMIHNYDNVVIKAYGLKTNIILTFCINVEGLLIPFESVKVKRKKNFVVIPQVSSEILEKVAASLNATSDTEALALRYKQSVGVEGLTTNKHVLNWLVGKQNGISDINHHLQIDNVIMQTILN